MHCSCYKFQFLSFNTFVAKRSRNGSCCYERRTFRLPTCKIRIMVTNTCSKFYFDEPIRLHLGAGSCISFCAVSTEVRSGLLCTFAIASNVKQAKLEDKPVYQEAGVHRKMQYRWIREDATDEENAEVSSAQ